MSDASDPADPADTDDVVHASALQLWAAAQTDFDPYEVPPDQWRDPVPVRDADIATDTRLDVDDVRAALGRLEGRLVLGRDAGTVAVLRPVPDPDVPL
jgi:hypothetical protein